MHTKYFKLGLFVLVLLAPVGAIAQTDTLVTSTGDILRGKIKSMDKGVLELDADYGDKNFRIKWMDIVTIRTTAHFRITINSGERYVGRIQTDRGIPGVEYIYAEDQVVRIRHSDIVQIDKLESNFKDKVDLGFDIGFDYANLTKIGHLSLGANTGFKNENMELALQFHSNATSIDTVVNGRGDAGISYIYLFGKKWYGLSNVQWYTSDLQSVDLMTTVLLGFGRFLFKDQRKELGITIGADYNRINYDLFPDAEAREGFIGITFDLFGADNIDLETEIYGFKDVENTDHFRLNYNVDLSIDILKDFDLTLGYRLNYNNQPIGSSKEGDYVVSLTFGWDL